MTMHVVVITPQWTPLGRAGADRYATGLVRAVAFAADGDVQVTLLSPGRAAATTKLAPGAMSRVVPMAEADDPRDVIGWAIEPVLRDADVAHVHAAFTPFGQAALISAGINRVPAVISDDGAQTLSTWGRAEMRAAAERVVASSDFHARLSGGPATIVPPAIDAEWYSPAPDGQRRRGFACAGRTGVEDTLARTLANLPQDTALSVCGDPGYDEIARGLAAQAGGRAISFVDDGDDSAVRDLYRSVHAVVLLGAHLEVEGPHSQPELAGLLVIEAAACGTPSIVSSTGGLAEFVVDGLTGFIVSDDAELGDALLRLRTVEGLSDELGAHARRHLEGRWDLRAVGQQALALYRDAAQEEDEAAVR